MALYKSLIYLLTYLKVKRFVISYRIIKDVFTLCFGFKPILPTLCVSVMTEPPPPVSPAAAAGADKKLRSESSLSAGTSWSAASARPARHRDAGATGPAGAAAGAGCHSDDDVSLRHQSTADTRHQRTSSLDNSRPSNVSQNLFSTRGVARNLFWGYKIFGEV